MPDRAARLALCLSMIDLTEDGTGYKAFDEPPRRFNWRALFVLAIVPAAFWLGNVTGGV